MEVMLSNQQHLVHLVQKANLSKEARKTRQRADPAEALLKAKERKQEAEARAEVQPKVATRRSLDPRISGRREPKRIELPAFFVGHHSMHPDFTILV